MEGIDKVIGEQRVAWGICCGVHGRWSDMTVLMLRCLEMNWRTNARFPLP